MDWKRWSKKKLTTQVAYCVDSATVQGRPLPNTSNNSTCVVNFFDQRFQSTKSPVFVNILSNCFAPYFLFSRKRFIKYLSSVLNPIIDV